MSNILTNMVRNGGNFQSISSLYTSSLAVDVIRISSMEGRQLFTLARPIKAGVNLDSELFEHPLETGNKITDFKIDKPTVVQLALLVPSDAYTSVYNEIRQAKVAGTEMVVQTRSGSYANLVIQAMPHEESPETGEQLVMSLTLREVQWFNANVETLPRKEVSVSPQSTKKGGTAKPDADTVKIGQQRAGEAGSGTKKKAESILYGWF